MKQNERSSSLRDKQSLSLRDKQSLSLRDNQKGYGMIIVMVAFLVLFTAISLVKIGSLGSIHPDLQRIGIHLNDEARTTADESTITPIATGNPQLVDTPDNNLEVASTDLDAADANEGDNPAYIE